MYVKINQLLLRFFKPSTVYKYLFNLSPMYRRSTGKINYVSEDLLKIIVKIAFSYRNKNYVGTIFGGSLFSATDPIFMIQLIQILGSDYMIWDKSGTIHYKRPATKNAYAVFEFSKEEIKQLKKEVAEKNEITLTKELNITDKEGNIYCNLEKVLYIADRKFYKEKAKRRKEQLENSSANTKKHHND